MGTQPWTGLMADSGMRRVSDGVEDSRKLPTRPPQKRPKAVLGVARPQGIEGSGMAGPGETLRSLWIPLAIWAYG
jgi:hypothetical protein